MKSVNKEEVQQARIKRDPEGLAIARADRPSGLLIPEAIDELLDLVMTCPDIVDVVVCTPLGT